MCTSFCFLALLELTWHGSLSEQAILNTSHINYWFLSKCNCSQGNIPFYNFDSKVSSFYWVPHTPRKWTDKKTDGYVNLRNVQSGSALSRYIVGTLGSFNSIPCFDSSQILFSCFKSHQQKQNYQNTNTTKDKAVTNMDIHQILFFRIFQKSSYCSHLTVYNF